MLSPFAFPSHFQHCAMCGSLVACCPCHQMPPNPIDAEAVADFFVRNIVVRASSDSKKCALPLDGHVDSLEGAACAKSLYEVYRLFVAKHVCRARFADILLKHVGAEFSYVDHNEHLTYVAPVDIDVRETSIGLLLLAIACVPGALPTRWEFSIGACAKALAKALHIVRDVCELKAPPASPPATPANLGPSAWGGETLPLSTALSDYIAEGVASQAATERGKRKLPGSDTESEDEEVGIL